MQKQSTFEKKSIKKIEKLIKELDSPKFNPETWIGIAKVEIQQILGNDSELEKAICNIHFNVKVSNDKQRDLNRGIEKAKAVLIRWKIEIKNNGIPESIEVIDTSNFNLQKLLQVFLKISFREQAILVGAIVTIIGTVSWVSYEFGYFSSDFKSKVVIGEINDERTSFKIEQKKLFYKISKLEEVIKGQKSEIVECAKLAKLRNEKNEVVNTKRKQN